MTQVTAAHWITEAQDPDRWRKRLAARSATDPITGCVTWTGRIDRHGYGVFIIPPGRRQTGAHRAAWLANRGPIEHGLVLDHLCRNRACINVDHMEVVTVRVNSIRGNCGKHPRTRKTHCKWGHEFTLENTAWAKKRDGNVSQVCKTCRREAYRAA